MSDAELILALFVSFWGGVVLGASVAIWLVRRLISNLHVHAHSHHRQRLDLVIKHDTAEDDLPGDEWKKG